MGRRRTRTGYRARIKYDGQEVFIGWYATKEEAAAAKARFMERHGIEPDFRKRLVETKRVRYGNGCGTVRTRAEVTGGDRDAVVDV